jgi:hypothetical protein
MVEIKNALGHVVGIIFVLLDKIMVMASDPTIRDTWKKRILTNISRKKRSRRS